MIDIDTSTPVLLLGGRENAVDVARNLGRLGVEISASGSPGCRSMNSRYCSKALPVPNGQSTHEFWTRLLLSPGDETFYGHMIFAFCDDSLEFIEANHQALRQRYVIEDFVPELRVAMLDKKVTLELARKANVPAPNFWSIHSNEDVLAIRDEITFPVMVKPLKSHTFASEFGTKLFIIEDDFDEVVEKVTLARKHGHEVMVVEMIPGPDTLLTSHYTYITASGERLYDFTKGVIRRWPVNRGGACYHYTKWDPETAELGQRLFDEIGWRGIANVEFKRDTRDGQMKIIEVNSRFTAAHRLVTKSGAPIDTMIYCHLTGQAGPSFENYTQDLRMWYPLRDFMAYLQMRKTGDLSFLGWLKSVMFKRRVLPYFSFSDPMPTLTEMASDVGRAFRRVFRLDGKTR